jgi:hypothetical protein
MLLQRRVADAVDLARTTSAGGAPFLRVLCARVGGRPIAPWASPFTPRKPEMSAPRPHLESLYPDRVGTAAPGRPSRAQLGRYRWAQQSLDSLVYKRSNLRPLIRGQAESERWRRFDKPLLESEKWRTRPTLTSVTCLTLTSPAKWPARG